MSYPFLGTPPCRGRDFDPADPDLPDQEPPAEDAPVFSPTRECSLEGDIEALECGMETEVIARELYVQGMLTAEDEHAREAYQFLIEQEDHHYELLENTRDYLTDNQTWWDSTEMPFFIG